MERKIPREIKCLYKLVLKDHGKLSDLHKIVEFYSAYDKLTDLIKNNPEVPGNTYIPSVKMPKYLQWAKKYLSKRKRK